MGTTASKKSKGNSSKVKPPSAAAAPLRSKVFAAKAHAAVSISSFEKRVRRFYMHHKPEKLETVPNIINTWKGSEEMLMQALVERYGPEPTDAANAPMPPLEQASAENANVWAPRFARHLLAYRPEKLLRLSNMLDRVEGTDAAALMALIEKLGPEPEGPLPQFTPDIVLVSPNEELPEAVQEAADPQSAVEAEAELPVGETEVNVAPTHSFKRRLSSFLGVRAPEKLHTLGEYLCQYAEDEEGLFELLREKHGRDPTEGETQAYFVQRLEGLYAWHAPSRVAFAASEIAAQHGTEEEYLQSVARELGTDPMMIQPQTETHAHLFEHADVEKDEAPLHGADGGERQSTHVQDVDVKAEVPQDVKIFHREDHGDGTAGAPPESAALPTVNAPVSNAEPPAATAPAQLGTMLGVEADIMHVTGTFCRIVEGQQQQLTELQAGIDRIRSLMEGEFQAFSQKGVLFSPVAVRGLTEHASMTSPDPSPRSPYKACRLNDTSCGISKSISFDRHLHRHESVDMLLPPPPMSRPFRAASSGVRQPAVRAPSLFAFRYPSSPQQVRTLSEMLLEYERERESIRFAEKRLQSCGAIL
ncbi:hypothetical protein TraAM80_01183 [Trypanosoma rangeli]|uniref:Uncharacterized protein n=1 Tax=Trypanosoma rangeli TaxID=5698 RepID=A0A3R7P181_TRYRA|nr:uncharacterized protein TraAM80_01183 [Trypanosoma rangeli]RNF11056.1 hypothetical protein TraAM80_01183 [Trypanosoma rangeli]|eukprot:RNF11056.1 hypothetical protein TraAM80_01183 [Trypanosoma rangeli]